MSVTETWVDIDGYQGFYQVSNFGNVRSLDRIVTDKRLGSKTLKGKILSLCLDSSGYAVVVLQKNGAKESVKVHRLVALHFIPKIDGKNSVNHIDHVKSNNMVTNLEWCTPLENTAHMHMAGRNYSAFGEDNPASSLSEKDVLTIRELSKSMKHVDIALLFNVSDRTINKIVSRKRWSHI